MIMLILMILLAVIWAWIMAKVDEEHEKVEMAWKILALKAVLELVKQKKKQEGEADDSDDGASD